MRRGARGGKTTDRSAQKLAGSGPAGTSYVHVALTEINRSTLAPCFLTLLLDRFADWPTATSRVESSNVNDRIRETTGDAVALQSTSTSAFSVLE